MKRFLFFTLLFLLARASCFGVTIYGITQLVIFDGIQENVSAAPGTLVILYQGYTQIARTYSAEATTSNVAKYTFNNITAGGGYQLLFTYENYYQAKVNSFSLLNSDYWYDMQFSQEDTIATVALTLTDSINLPISGATVFALQNGAIYGTGQTNSNGLVTISGLATSTIDGTTSLLIQASQYQTYIFTYPISLGQQTFSIQLSFDTLATISGTITTSEGAADNVVVQCYNSSNIQIASTTTDSSGAYSISNLPQGNFSIVATLSGYQQGLASLNLPEGGAESAVDIELLDSPTTIVGNVYSFDTGLPIQGATLRLFRNQTFLSVVTSNEFGSFVFANCPSGSLVVNVSSKNYNSSSGGITLVQGSSGTLDLSLSSSDYSVSGTVESNGVPIEFATVSVSIGSSNQLTTSTFQDGTFTLSNLSLGSFGITATKDGYQSVTIPVEIRSTENQSLTFNLSLLPVTLSGQVVDEVTTPITNVLLLASLDGNLVESATTDSDGNYAFYNLPAGNVVVSANYPTLQQASQTFNFSAGDVVQQDFVLLSSPNTLTGAVIDALTNAPVLYATVLCQGANIPITSYCGIVGQFTFPGLNVDTYSLSAQQLGYVSDIADPITFSELDQTVTKNIYLYPEDAPPQNIEGNVILNNYGGGIVDIIHNITWEASLSLKVKSYNIYRDGVFLANIAATSSLEFNNHNQSKNVSTTYTVNGVNTNGSLSSSVEVILR